MIFVLNYLFRRTSFIRIIKEKSFCENMLIFCRYSIQFSYKVLNRFFRMFVWMQKPIETHLNTMKFHKQHLYAYVYFKVSNIFSTFFLPNESKSRGLIRIDRDIFFSSSSCSLVLVISRRASWILDIPASLRPPPEWEPKKEFMYKKHASYTQYPPVLDFMWTF